MPDITDRLAQLGHHSAADDAVNNDAVAADMRRGRSALRRRTRQRGAGAVGGLAVVAAIVAIIALAVNATSSAPTHRIAAVPPTPVVTHSTASRPVVKTSPTPNSKKTTIAQPTIMLVSYTGPQRAGFTIESVPAGYVLQGVSGSTLDIAEANDHSSLDTFLGKLTVGVEASKEVGGLSAYHGTPVTINGQTGVYTVDNTGIAQLVFEQGHSSGNLVDVQCWNNIKLTQDQLIEFARGVTVTADVQRQHG